MSTINVSSSKRIELIDITRDVIEFVRKSNLEEGVIFLYVPHTTAGIIINENADPSVREDIEDTLSKLAPYSRSYKHTEGNADAHIKASLVGSSAIVMVESGRLLLGTWQGIFFCEFDGPRNRKVFIIAVSSKLHT